MHEDYLASAISYHMLEDCFARTFKEAIEAYGLSGNFITPYYHTAFNNGQPFRDANPIFSAKSLKSSNTIRIIIEEDSNNVSVVEENKDNGLETIAFGGIKNLNELLESLRHWIANSGS
ncbi:hypothetical protein [Pseudomonas cremoricolorata]|uniref:Uncharacterized protein n=1 Tax=Pseudomonas cremoricolorata TaxID=157783 RepID=A0A089WRL3_9PSED|nr:hypothetical protein [Pseudomonas cremoricolorata]AIR91226.1 hypothetical protein LK03_19000 [Pseudomonas cremoricolorata]